MRDARSHRHTLVRACFVQKVHFSHTIVTVTVRNIFAQWLVYHVSKTLSVFLHEPQGDHLNAFRCSRFFCTKERKFFCQRSYFPFKTMFKFKVKKVRSHLIQPIILNLYLEGLLDPLIIISSFFFKIIDIKFHYLWF